MGYYVQQQDASVAITKDNWDKLHIDHPELFTEDSESNGLLAELFDVDIRDDTGKVIALFYMPEKWYDDEIKECMTIIAPYVEDGSMLSFIGEDDSMWGYIFQHGGWSELCASMVCYDVKQVMHLREYILEHLPDSTERRQLVKIIKQL